MAAPIRRFLGVSLLCALYVTAHPSHTDNHNHVDSINRRLPSTQWYHDEDHPVNALFKRDTATPGTAAWQAQYPPPGPNTMTAGALPQAWLDALHAAEAAGLIPDIPVSFAPPDGSSPVYPNNADPTSQEICSSTAKCRGNGDIWDAPDNTVAIGFDDGPEEGSALLYDFLQQNNIPSTHFMIGSNIVWSYPLFQRAFVELNVDIAVHTWDHRLMTNLSNEVALGELAWTMQIIADSTGGRVPKFWRPPYGDSDNRIRAIAKEILGLTQINWNQDSEDWTIAAGKTTVPAVESSISGWYAGAKSPGLIILEHELTNDTSGAFINTFPGIAENGWQMASTLQLFGGSWKNADSNTAPINTALGNIILPQPSVTSTSTTAPSTSVKDRVVASPTSKVNTFTDLSQSGTAAPAQASAKTTNSASQLRFTTSSSLAILLLLSISSLSTYL
ncbi:carbohydrate esterase family 4 protein [Sphaerobolus stellatus SS14]|nr:carbohydrate esterase family 4 protein [Sphaerobolus stellatus SS14]